jgi:class 3 adenylate cyclase/tetratricopeptide (TPR) repeat protein
LGLEAQAKPPRSDRRVVTVLFLDVSGFTAMSEKLDPEQVTEIVNAFFAVLTEPIYRFGGVVDKYMGDAIMALFGAPVAHEDDPIRAVHAALAMQQAAEVFSDRLEQDTGIRLQVRIGINTGLVVAGVVGGAQKKDYTVMGDSVNLAQRMEANAKPGTILVTADTYRAAMHAADFVALEPILVKGKRDPVPVYQVVSLRTDLGHPAGARRMAGREQELEQLWRAFESCMDGVPQVVFITGEAGIGKSQLFAQFAARLDPALGVDVQKARAISYEQGNPYGFLASFIRRWLGLRGKSDAAVTVTGLQAWAGSVPFLPAEKVGQVAIATAYLLGLDTGNSAFEQLTPQQRRVMAFNAFNTALLASVQARPMVLDLEDLHWADEPSIEWIQSLFDMLASRQYQNSRIMVIGMARPTEGSPIPNLKPRREALTLELTPLNPDECWTLISGLLEGRLQPDALPEPLKRLLDRIQARAEGNPLFLTELLRSLLDSGAIAKDAKGTWQVTTTQEPKLPATVSGVLGARFDRLPDQQRHVLQVASVIGRTFQTSLLSRAGELYQLDRVMEELVGAEFLRVRSAEEFLFYLALTHEVVYDSLLLSARRDLHRRVGEILEADFGDRRDENPQVLARHFLRGEAPEKALHYLFLSGQHALRNFANQEALLCFKQCLVLIDKGGELPASPSRFDVLVSLADLLSTTGQYEPAFQHLEQALALQSEPSRKADTLRRLGNALNLQGKYRDAMERYEEGLATNAANPDPLVQARILQDQSLSLFRQGQYVEVVTLCQQSLTTLAGSRHLKEIAMAESILGLVCYRQNRPAEAEAYHRQALAKRESLEDLFGIASSLNNLGVLYLEGGEWGKAYEHYVRSLTIYQQIGDISRQIIQLINLSDLLRNQGELQLALQHYKQVRDLSEQSQDSFGRAYAALGFGMVLLEDGQIQAASSQLQEGIGLLEAINAREVLPEALVALARSYLQDKRIPEAQATLLRALDLARENSSSLQIGLALGVDAMLTLESGEPAAARETIREAVKQLRDGGSLIDLARGLAIEATVLEACGAIAEAEARREEAAALFKRLGAHLDLRQLQGTPR